MRSCADCGRALFADEAADYCYRCWRAGVDRIAHLLALGRMGTIWR